MKVSSDPTAEWKDDELDSSLKILADSARRRLLRQLSRKNGGVATIDELCDGLAIDGVGRPASDDARLALSHVHLPMLSDAGIVDVNWGRETVRYRRGHCIESLLGSILATTEA